jgi:DNA-binding Xre family transcriptional regulator
MRVKSVQVPFEVEGVDWTKQIRKKLEESMKGKEPTFDGEPLRAMRKERGLSARDVERMAKVTARHIWRLEAGKRPNMAAVTLARIARALEVDMEYLVGLSDSLQPNGGEAGRRR